MADKHYRLLDWLRWRKAVRVSDTKTRQQPRRFGHWFMFLERRRVIRFLRQTGQLEKLEIAKHVRGRATERTIETAVTPETLERFERLERHSIERLEN